MADVDRVSVKDIAEALLIMISIFLNRSIVYLIASIIDSSYRMSVFIGRHSPYFLIHKFIENIPPTLLFL